MKAANSAVHAVNVEPALLVTVGMDAAGLGEYVRADDRDEVYLASDLSSTDLAVQPSSWVERAYLDVPAELGWDAVDLPDHGNPMGMKGCGEAGTVVALAAVANAVQDAMWAKGGRQADMPFTPQRVWSWLESARQAAE